MHEKQLLTPFCVTVVGARFFYKDKGSIEEEDQEVYRYATVGVGGRAQETAHRPGNYSGVEWGDVLQFDKSKTAGDSEIVVEVYTKWKLSSELIGEIHLPYERYKDVSVRYALLHWYPMKLDRPIDPQVKGEIGLIMGFFEEGDALKGKKPLSIDDPAHYDMNADDILVEVVKVARENNAKVKKLARMTQQANDIAHETSEQFSEQMELRKRVENDFSQINNDLIFAEAKVKNIESCWSMFCGRNKAKRIVKKNTNIREKAAAKSVEEKKRAEERKLKAEAKDGAKHVPKQGGKALSELLVAPTNGNPELGTKSAQLKSELKREALEIDSGLEVVHEGVKELKAKALAIRDNLDEDFPGMEGATNMATKNMAHVQRVNDRTSRLI